MRAHVDQLILLTVFTCLCTVVNASQIRTETPRLGMSVIIGDSQSSVMLPVWIASNIVIVPSFGLSIDEDGWSDLYTGFGIRIVRRMESNLHPYVGISCAVLGSIYGWNEDRTFNYLLVVAYGGEYFLTKNFSLGIEAQLKLANINNRRLTQIDQLGVNINSVSKLYATLYF